MNSRFAASMQQKYCDHGRSMPLLMITWPIFLARSSWGTGGKPMSASIFPSAKQLHRLSARMNDEVDVAGRIKADIGRHADDEQAMRRLKLLHRDRLALEVANRSDALRSK